MSSNAHTVGCSNLKSIDAMMKGWRSARVVADGEVLYRPTFCGAPAPTTEAFTRFPQKKNVRRPLQRNFAQ